jgi:hypothetical protein
MAHSVEAVKNPPQPETQAAQPARGSKKAAPKHAPPQQDTVKISSAAQAIGAQSAAGKGSKS